jgi:hypothetical protein
VVMVRRLPDSGEQELAAPRPVTSRRMAVRDTLRLRAGGLGPGEALVVSIQSPAA